MGGPLFLLRFQQNNKVFPNAFLMVLVGLLLLTHVLIKRLSLLLNPFPRRLSVADLEFGGGGGGGGEVEGGWLLKYRPHSGIVLEHFMYEEHDFLIRCSDAPEISCTVVVFFAY